MFDHFSVPAGYQITDGLLCLFVIPWALESVIHLKESGIPLKNRIPSSIEGDFGIQNVESGIHCLGSRIQDCHGAIYRSSLFGSSWRIKHSFSCLIYHLSLFGNRMKQSFKCLIYRFSLFGYQIKRCLPCLIYHFSLFGNRMKQSFKCLIYRFSLFGYQINALYCVWYITSHRLNIGWNNLCRVWYITSYCLDIRRNTLSHFRYITSGCLDMRWNPPFNNNNNTNFICIAVYTKALYRFTIKKENN